MPIKLDQHPETLDMEKLAEKLRFTGEMPSAQLIASIDESTGRILGYVKGTAWSGGAIAAGVGFWYAVSQGFAYNGFVAYFAAIFFLLCTLRAYQNFYRPGRLSDTFRHHSLVGTLIVKYAPKLFGRPNSKPI